MNNISKYVALAATGMLMSVTSCDSKQKSANSGSDTFGTTEISWADSIKGNNCSAKCFITAEYPSEGNEALLDSTRSWIAHSLMTIMPVDTAAVDTLFTPEVLADGQKLIAGAGKRFLNESGKDFQGLDEADGFSFNYEYRADIDDTFATDSVVTYTSSIYIYTGGAHGASFDNGVTFRTSDGAPLGYDIFDPNSLPELTQMVKEAIAEQYFKNDDDFKLEDALIVDPQDIRLPANAPYFTEKGLKFIYQEYEITCYAAGRPTCTLPYSAIAPLLTPASRSLLPN